MNFISSHFSYLNYFKRLLFYNLVQLYQVMIILKLIEGIKNYTIDSAKGRQEINNLGSGTGYYITNGYALKITWKKESVESKTIYKYEDGTEIKVNDGNTYIELQPTNKILNIIENKENSSSD